MNELILVYLVGSAISYGYTLAYLQREFDAIAEKSFIFDIIVSVICGLLSWFGLFCFMLATLGVGNTFKHGFKFK